MTTRFPYTPFIPAPGILPEGAPVPAPVVARTTVRELCVMAGIPLRATSPHTPDVVLHRGTAHLRSADAYLVALGRRRFSAEPREAIRILEILAHGFHDYVTRESICGRGLFLPPPVRGRPPTGGRSMTAAERMRRMRSRRRR